MSKVMEIYTILLDHFGAQNWWPGDTPFEVAVGAILTQQTKWSNVEKAIQNLTANHMLDPVKIDGADRGLIEELILPTGFYRQKSRYLKSFCHHLVQRYNGDLRKFFLRDLWELRKELLTLPGIGPETADSILLYAGGKLTFVVDAYTIRAGRRLGLFETDKYDPVKEFFERNVDPTIVVYNEYHALIIILVKTYCTVRFPRCSICPLKSLCETGRVEGV